MADTQTVAGVFAEMQTKFRPEKAQGLDATFQFDISGDDGGVWHAIVKDGTATFGEGPADNPTVTIKAESGNWLNIVNGSLNPQMAFMTGKLKVTGNIALATKLQSLFL